MLVCQQREQQKSGVHGALPLHGEDDFQEALELGREDGFATCGRPGSLPKDSFGLSPQRIRAQAKLRQSVNCEVAAGLEKAHEQMLGADRLVPTAPRLLGGTDQHLPRTLGEPFQHVVLLPESEWTSREYPIGRRRTGGRSLRGESVLAAHRIARRHDLVERLGGPVPLWNSLPEALAFGLNVA